MTNKHWKTIFNTTVDGRSVEGLVYIEGDLKVKTTTKYDFEGSVHNDFVLDPVAAGSPVGIEGATKAELQANLMSEADFSEDDANMIIEEFGDQGSV